MYRVLAKFTDLQDNKYAYKAGDIFPREGLKVSADRINELSTSANRRGIPLIEKIEEPKKTKGPEKVEIAEEIQEPEETEEPEIAEEAEKPRKRGRKSKE